MPNDLEAFLQHLQLSVAATTYMQKKAVIKAFLRYLIGKKKNYIEVTKPDIEEYLLQLPGGMGYKQQTCKVIKEFYDYVKAVPNPASKIKFLHSSYKHRLRLFRIPSASKVQEIITLTGEKDHVLDKRNVLMLELAYGSGLRRTELLRLDVEDVDTVERTVHVCGKRNKERVVPVTQSALHALKEYIFRSENIRGPLLRSRTNKRLTPEEVTNIFKKKIGFNPHLFRHACATHMLQNGCNIRYIQELLGHSGLDSTQIYTHTCKEDLKKVLLKTHPMSLLAEPRF